MLSSYPLDWVPRFRSNLQIVDVGPAGFCLVSEYDTFLLEGYSFKVMVPLIDGTRLVSGIIDACRGTLSQQDAERAFQLLQHSGYLEDVATAGPQPINALCAELGTTFAAAAQLVASRPVQIINMSAARHDDLSELLERSGVHIDDREPYVTLVLADDFRDQRLDELNRSFRARSHPWLLVKVTGHNVWIGPLFITDVSPCWSCLDHRLTRNRELVAYSERLQGKRQVLTINVNTVASSRWQAYGAIVNQLVRVLVDRLDMKLPRHVKVFDTLSLHHTEHFVVKRPECEVCGNQFAAQRQTYDPRAATVTGSALGGQRRESPEVTFERFRHHISPLTGIVTAIEPSPYNGSTPLRVYTAGHNFALSRDAPSFVKDSIRALSSGKGRTDAEARTSALCEALERFSGMFQGTEPRIHASFETLGNRAIDPRSCLLFSERQYHERDAWMARRSRFQVVPYPLDPAASLDWSEVSPLGGGESRYLPTSYLYYGYPSSDRQPCWSDSNGCAGGTSFEDACLQGLLELVERDATAIWWYNRDQVPAVDLATLGETYYEHLQSFYRSIGREFWVLDLTHDFGIPVCCSISRRVGGPTEDIILGLGAHLDLRIAVNRAVTEMNQFMPSVLQVGPDQRTIYAFDDPDALTWWQTATLQEKTYLQPSGGTAIDRLHCPDLNSIEDMLSLLANRIRAAGIEIFVLNQTRAEVGLPCVKMIAPGLRHFWARFAPGRLYDVPVKIGRRASQNSEEELNPIPLFI